jgi:hypothetical protein
MPTTHDLPAHRLRTIADNPNLAQHAHALADRLFLQAREDEAAAVRVLSPMVRDNLEYVFLETTLADVARNAVVLGTLAREVERRDDETPPV